MNNDEFVKNYYEFAERALKFSEISRSEGLLALDNKLYEDKIKERDIFEYGMRFVVDGTERTLIERILSNIIAQEKDALARQFKLMQKEAVLMLQEGMNYRIVHAMLNSFTGLSLNEDKLTMM
ncbi:MAG: hypothetical protein FWD40_02060 [Treponema sp.]|nr:hypothetical protein [Treponema sp.]